MVELLARHWWAVALRGFLAVAFGIVTLLTPGLTLFYLVLLFGGYAILEGIFNMVSAVRAPRHHWPLLLEGMVGIIAGVLTFAWPGITALFLLYLIAFWAIFTGVLEITAGIRLRRHLQNEWLLMLMGILSVLFGVLILRSPGTGALAIVLWIGSYALIFGGTLIALAFRLRPLAHAVEGTTASSRAS
jgi:uncharacterized membrane protein HdeD (DUF308 family)